MNKFFSSVTATVILVMMVLSGCTNTTTNYKAEIPLDEMATLIQENVAFAMMMPVTPENSLYDFFQEVSGLEQETMNAFSFHVNMRISADSLLIAEAKTSEDLLKVQEAFEKYRANVERSFETYLARPYAVAQNGKIVAKGNYVMLVMSEDNEKAIEIFEAKIQ